MWFSAIATDYDGTLATEGVLSDKAISALLQVRESGRFVILLTGRILPDLRQVCPRFELFDTIVLENGALLHTPATGNTRQLVPPISPRFFERLSELNVTPLTRGEVIAATLAPLELTVQQVILELELPLQIIRNKNSIMVLPIGIDKGTGLKAAELELNIPDSNVMGFGDAENDSAFLQYCGCKVAVANALPEIRKQADIVSPFPNGAGVIDTLQKMLTGKL